MSAAWIRRFAAALANLTLPIALAACAFGPPQPVPATASRSALPATTAAPAASPAPPATAAAPAAPAAAAGTPPAPPAPPPLPFDEALLRAASDLFAKATLPADAPARLPLVIDPLVDGVTGAQSSATRTMGQRIVQLVHDRYPRFEVLPFTGATVAQSPIVLIGTFTPINQAGQRDGPRDVYRICLALADFRTGKIVSKGVARALPADVDASPTAHFDESPAWLRDRAVEGYIKTCQGTRPGDPIDSFYADRIVAAALIADAIDAYNARRYGDALELYRSALQTPGGDQLRAFNGVYLATWKLGRRPEATQAFGRIVDYGLDNSRLAVKFLFRPGSTQFVAERELSDGYPMWLEQIAQRAAERSSCLEIVGHTSPTGPAAVNDRLSALRAQYVQQRLETRAPKLAQRTIANGVGSRENLVGTGRDDTSDALDRRVEFKVIDCRA